MLSVGPRKGRCAHVKTRIIFENSIDIPILYLICSLPDNYIYNMSSFFRHLSCHSTPYLHVKYNFDLTMESTHLSKRTFMTVYGSSYNDNTKRTIHISRSPPSINKHILRMPLGPIDGYHWSILVQMKGCHFTFTCYV